MSLSYGLGDTQAQFKVYIANRPNFNGFDTLLSMQALNKGEIFAIGQACGNGWRKVFNVYSKLLFALNCKSILDTSQFQSWQQYRDQSLLQAGSNTALLFSEPLVEEQTNQSLNSDIHIVMGKTYANGLPLSASLDWLDKEFAINKQSRLIVCPYFDYRQLSNMKIIRLVELINSLQA